MGGKEKQRSNEVFNWLGWPFGFDCNRNAVIPQEASVGLQETCRGHQKRKERFCANCFSVMLPQGSDLMAQT